MNSTKRMVATDKVDMKASVIAWQQSYDIMVARREIRPYGSIAYLRYQRLIKERCQLRTYINLAINS